VSLDLRVWAFGSLSIHLAANLDYHYRAYLVRKSSSDMLPARTGQACIRSSPEAYPNSTVSIFHRDLKLIYPSLYLQQQNDKGRLSKEDIERMVSAKHISLD
jgi:hypothetical protein